MKSNAKEFAVTYQNSIRQGQDLEKKNSEISYLNKNLEKLVEQKTSQVRSLLDNIPQGVLSIEDGGEISPDYSAHLKIILGVKDITDETFFDLVLKHSTLSMDEQDQVMFFCKLNNLFWLCRIYPEFLASWV